MDLNGYFGGFPRLPFLPLTAEQKHDDRNADGRHSQLKFAAPDRCDRQSFHENAALVCCLLVLFVILAQVRTILRYWYGLQREAPWCASLLANLRN